MGAFVAVVLVGMTVVTVIANRATAREFEHFMFQGRMIAAEDMRSALADYYAGHGSWEGVQQLLSSEGMDNMMGRMRMGQDMGMGMMGGMMSSHLEVVDAQTRRVVADTIRTDIGRPVSGQEWNEGLPIRVRGRTVGALLVKGAAPMSPRTSALQTEFLDRVNRAILLAALAAGVVALVLGGLLVRQITAPLGELARVADRIAGGDLDARVEATGSDELARVGSAFNRMASSLSRQEQLRRNLMADIAHELRTPLSVIQGQVEALQDGVFSLTPDALEPVHSNARLLSRLVDDLRTLAHAEAGRLKLNRQAVSLSELVPNLLNSLRSEAEAGDVTLEAEVPTDLRPVNADPQRLRQILLNLLSNALRHTPAGGTVRVQASMAGGSSSAPPHILVTVRDTGPGIAPEELPHIFDRFYRGDKSRSRESGGTGLGLSIAKQLVEAHGGRIWVESSGTGQGSTFSFVIPLSSDVDGLPGTVECDERGS
jgi:two-component system OmpR family sensor kinase/two-component system sensor histidine kinase BaeS